MSKPVEIKNQNPAELFAAALKEIHSARSALNMEPKTKEGHTYGDGGYLSNVDVWAEDAYAHLGQAIDMLLKYNLDIAFGK